MTWFAGIQLTSPMVENTAFPLDRKTYCADKTERNGLSVTQRWKWMQVWVVSELNRFKLNNEPLTTNTTDSDRGIFGWASFLSWSWNPEWVVDSSAWQIYVDTAELQFYMNPNTSWNTWRQLLQTSPA